MNIASKIFIVKIVKSLDEYCESNDFNLKSNSQTNKNLLLLIKEKVPSVKNVNVISNGNSYIIIVRVNKETYVFNIQGKKIKLEGVSSC